MLAESIIRIGRPIVQSPLPIEERIRWLTDVSDEKCKNFFKHIFVVEIDGDQSTYHFLQLAGDDRQGTRRNSAFPVIYPNGGNPLAPQGVYPVPCYLMYEKHIEKMDSPDDFAKKVILPRLKNTVPYKEISVDRLNQISTCVAKRLNEHFSEFISNEKQLGILYIVDHQLPVFCKKDRCEPSDHLLWIMESSLKPNEHIYLDGSQALKGIVESRFMEAKTLGYEENAVSTFTNKKESEVVSIYNKSWLWLSPTWEMPRSIYWSKNEWTKGIKVDKESYEAFLYGVQFLKQITVPITGGLLKELFAPTMNVEAKKHMKATSFEQIYGVPLVLPLLEGDSEQLFEKYDRILKKEVDSDDLQLKILLGIDKAVPKMSNEHRLMILYYSGDLSRGNMHVRMVIEDVIPSVAATLQRIIDRMNRKELFDIRQTFHAANEKPFFRSTTLPTLLSNAYGPGYIWSSLQSVMHKEPIQLDRLFQTTSAKLTELANKEDYWSMVDELIFHYIFLVFFDEYSKQITKEKGVNRLSHWIELAERYYVGEISSDELESIETLGFVTGLLLKQFSNSYQVKTGKDFVKHRVMKFGSKLTPEIVWKNGLMICEPLRMQRDLKISGNFYPLLGAVLSAFADADRKGLLRKEKDVFMTMFWSGYLVYRKPEKDKEAEKDRVEEEVDK